MQAKAKALSERPAEPKAGQSMYNSILEKLQVGVKEEILVP
jgi:hypothetical protein